MPEWAGPGGRLMATSLSSLTLEVCYRYPPRYAQANGESGKNQGE